MYGILHAIFKGELTGGDRLVEEELGAKFGVEMKDIHWTLGAYDLVVECEARDEAAMVAYTLAICSAGNVRFQSLRALGRDEMMQVLQKMP